MRRGPGRHRRAVAAVAAALAICAAGCIDFGWQSGQFVCDTDDECPGGFHCENGECVEGPGHGDTDTDTDTDIDTDADTDTDTDTDIDTDTDTDTDADTDTDTDADTETCGDVDDCAKAGECASASCDMDAGLCDYEPDAGPCAALEGECAVGLTCTYESSAGGYVCDHDVGPTSACPINGCADRACVEISGKAVCQYTANAGNCIPLGECDAPDCEHDIDAGVFECAHAGNAALCTPPECGDAECDTALDCEYTADDADCAPMGACGSAVCTASESVPGECVYFVDWSACTPGQTCSGEPSYTCGAGGCLGGTVGTEVQVSDTTGATNYPSVAATGTGYGVAWQDTTGATYGQVYFARLDASGALIAGSEHAVSSGTTGNFPTLLWLGATEGYALVMQGWNATLPGTYEIYLGFLNTSGVLVGSFIQISDVDSTHSRYPDAVFAPGLGTSGRIGIVWSDTRNMLTAHDVYAAVYDLATDALVDSGGDVNHRLTGISLDEYWPIATATSSGFLTAVIAATTEQIVTIETDDDGVALSAPTYVAPALTASRPLDVAFDGVDEVGLVWRDDRYPTQMRMMFRPLDVHGAFAGDIWDGLAVGDALSDVSSGFPSYYIGEASLAFDTAEDVYVLAWDAEPGVNGGDARVAEVFVTLIADGGGSFDAPFQISTATGRSVMPALAIGGSYLAAWHDNRETPTDTTTFAGEIYAATLSCP